jgi:hypothetical protein
VQKIHLCSCSSRNVNMHFIYLLQLMQIRNSFMLLQSQCEHAFRLFVAIDANH